MELIVFFTKVLALNFSVSFLDNGGMYQDYLILNGEECSLHLFQNQTIIYLVLSDQYNITNLSMVSEENISFAVPSLKLNGKEMGEVDFECQYYSFMFIDPIFSEIVQLDQKLYNQDELILMVSFGALLLLVTIASVVIGYKPVSRVMLG